MPTQGSSLSSRAFGKLADSGLIVAYQSHQDALRFLAAALSQENGIALLQGPRGAGKTTIVHEQLGWSSRDASVAWMDGTHLAPRRLLTGMLSQLGSSATTETDEQLLQTVNNVVTRQTRSGESPVLIVDNVDQATSSTLRLLNWLAALETQGRYAIRMVLTGREGLSSLLGQDSTRNIARRHPATYTLNPLTVEETMIYLRTRLIAAGGERSEKVFTIDVCDQLHERSRGWPGPLNQHAVEVMDRMTELKSARRVPRVIVTRDGKTVGEYSLKRRQYVIGRSEMADIMVEDTYVSKIHAMLQVYANAVVLLDLNSTNGTTVNSSVVLKTILKNNDVISLGNHRLKIENVPALTGEMGELIEATDTLTMKNLDDIRRSRARRTIAALKHK
jgi:type II secretory pathway predicted ATPase ExeA